jgi:F0F1-type ATP synthase assembly protein I
MSEKEKLDKNEFSEALRKLDRKAEELRVRNEAQAKRQKREAALELKAERQKASERKNEERETQLEQQKSQLLFYVLCFLSSIYMGFIISKDQAVQILDYGIIIALCFGTALARR